MSHEALPDESAAVGQAVWKSIRLGIEEQAWRSDAVARHDHDTRLLLVEMAIRIVVHGAVCDALFVDYNLAHRRPRPQDHAVLNRSEERRVGKDGTSGGEP